MLGIYQDFLERKRKEYGDKFDTSELALQFVHAFNDQQRIRVKFPWGEVKTGIVGITGGWRPVFLLIRNKNQVGSSDILTHDVLFTTEKCGMVA